MEINGKVISGGKISIVKMWICLRMTERPSLGDES